MSIRKNKFLKKSCDGKVRHKSEAAAKYVLQQMPLSLDKNRPLETYFCQSCKSWHIGHRPKRKVKTEEKTNA